MRALMVNSTSGNIIDEKMRDEMYMRHLREVEKISNREADNIAKDIRHYRSINDLHHKHKSYAFEWHHKEEQNHIEEKNNQIKHKISQIRSYFHSKTHRKRNNELQETSPLKLDTVENSDKNPEQINQKEQTFWNNGSDSRKSQEKEQSKMKRQISLHYRYRQRRQQEIDRENTKLIKAIQSQRSSYLPKIYRSRHKNGTNSKSIQKDIQELPLETDRM